MSIPTFSVPNGVRCRILHVTDNEVDYRLLRECVRDHPELSITHAITGESALDILDHPPNADEQPNVVFLSWFLPTMTGEDVLKRIKSDVRFKPIPVIVFTSVTEYDEINRIYALGASCVIRNPMDFNVFMDVMQSFVDFWGRVATLPFCRSIT